jgi:phenylacetate-CoA ligase
MELEELYQEARHHPWYRDRFRPDGSLPILTKAELYAGLQGRESDPFFAHNTYWSPSGGSGARTPLYFPTAVEENLLQRRLLADWLRQEGILGPQTIALNLFSSRMMYRACEIFVDYVQMCGGTALSATFQAKDCDLPGLVERFRPNTLMGSPSRLVQWAHTLSRPEPFERILYASETLVPAAQTLLEERFGQPLWSSLMGSAEAGVWGFSRPQDPCHLYWAPRELVELEVAEADDDGFGRLIVTNRVRRRHPLLRYDSGDRVRLLPGYQHNLVGLHMAGRHAHSFQFAGQYYELEEFSRVLEGAACFQFVLSFEQRDVLQLRLVADPERAEAARSELLRVVRADSRLNQVQLHLCQPQDLVRAEHSGKIPPILDHRPC